jgi:hypothetical protein
VNACPKCAGEMVAGSCWSGAGHHYWATGDAPPEQNIHLFPPGLEWSSPRLRIVTYRCAGCGFLESYAPDARARGDLAG